MPLLASAQLGIAADIPARTSAFAPSPIAVQSGSSWSFSINAYAWAAGVDGTVRTLPPLPAADVSIGFDQVLQNLNGALMVSAEAQNGRFILFTDLLLSQIAPEKAFSPAGYPASVAVESTSFIALGAVGYRLLDQSGLVLDGFVGARGFAIRNTLTVQLAPRETSYVKSEQWADAVVGARLRYSLTPSLAATIIGFAGAGGSTYEWDVFGGFNYAFNPTWGALLGYRALKVEYKHGDFIYDAIQHGPVVGLNARF